MTKVASALYGETTQPITEAPSEPSTSGETAPEAKEAAGSPAPTAKEGGAEAKAGDDKGKEAKSADAPASDAPLTVESYKDLALPEGLEVDDTLFTQFKEVAAATGVPPEKAPALLDLYQKALASQQEANIAYIRDQDAKWRAELEAIPEFSGERAARSRAVLGRAIEEFGGSPEQVSRLRTTFDTYGLSNNPDLARLLYNMSVGLVEGIAPTPGTPAPNGGQRAQVRGKSLGQVLYPETQQ
jgi:hypothetical protein